MINYKSSNSDVLFSPKQIPKQNFAYLYNYIINYLRLTAYLHGLLEVRGTLFRPIVFFL